MATIKDLLQGNLVIEDIKSVDKPGVIREFASLLQHAGKVAAAEELVRVLMEREALGSTGIGDGVAIPHGKLRGIGDIVVAFGRSRQGVEFQSMDEKPAHIFFLLVTPDDRPGEHLKTLARISRILKNPDLRQKLLEAPHGRDLLQLILEEDLKYPQK
jgi:PTS system nitrogen regulatory IIA component